MQQLRSYDCVSVCVSQATLTRMSGSASKSVLSEKLQPPALAPRPESKQPKKSNQVCLKMMMRMATMLLMMMV